MSVAVIVALHRVTPEARQCLEETARQLRPGDQLIAVTDHPVDGLPNDVHVHLTGSPIDTSPAEKRDAAMSVVTAEICAFLDDDAYPAPGWLARAEEYFREDPELGGIGGPGITPPGGDLATRLGGAFYESRFGSGGLRERFVAIGERHPIDDWPAYNFFVRTSALAAVGGWASSLYGGEDTKLCLALISAGHRLDFVPDVIVFHHRRRLFGPLWRQVGNIGYQRGRFVRRYPETSRRLIYFAPSLGLIALVPLGIAAIVSSTARARLIRLFTLGWVGVSAVSVADGMDASKALLTPVALATGHGAYAWRFIRGLLTNDRRDLQ